MSSKRMFGIAIFGVLFIAAVICVLLLTSYCGRDNTPIRLPEAPTTTVSPSVTQPDIQDRVEITRDNVQAVISTLSRPDVYRRDVVVETFWEGGRAVYNIGINVANGITSLRITPPNGIEKRIIVTEDTLYIWYRGDSVPFVGPIGSSGDGYRTADEWQMIATYEDILELNINDIIEADYVEFGGEECVYVDSRSPLLGYTRKCFVSVNLGLVTGAEEYDETGGIVYFMAAEESTVGEVDPGAFILPDGHAVITV